jgi:hypothetical protein
MGKMPHKDPIAGKAYHTAYRASHQEEIQAYNASRRAIRAANKKEKTKQTKDERRAKRNAYMKIYHATHKELFKAKRLAHAEQRSISGKLYYAAIRNKVLEFYGGKCACCGETENHFLTIDHINGGGNKHRKEIKGRSLYVWLANNDYPEGFQVLCYNCNMSKGHYGICPHQSEKEKTCQNNLHQQEKN